jgi:hypothetical protein
MRGTLPLLLVLTAALGCQSKKSDAIVAAPTQPTAGAMAAAPAPGQGLTGKVLERLDAPPYCYLRIQTARGEVWAAVPQEKVEKGAEVTVVNPMVMNNFESKTLNRTFPEVFFGTLASSMTGAAPASAAGAPTPGVASGAATTPPGTPVATAVAVGKVAKATGAEARTIAETWAQKGALKEKTVTIRGQVVRYNPGVMGKNWLHLQDGSGDAAKGTHDITVTSQDTVTKGDVVTIKGTVRLDKDFGAGYTYALIVEEAKIEKK